MDYRSDVYITMTKTRYKDMLAEAICSGEKLETLVLFADKTYEDDSNMIVLKIYNVKWYSDYPETRFIEDFLYSSEDGYHFVRIGEEFEDVERQSDDGYYGEEKWNYAFNVYRNVEVNMA